MIRGHSIYFFLVLGRNFNSDKSLGSSATSSVSYAKISVKQIHRIEKLSTSFAKVSREICELCLVEMTIGKQSQLKRLWNGRFKKNKTTDRVEGNMIMSFLSKTIDTIAAEHCIISWNLIQRLNALYRLKTTAMKDCTLQENKSRRGAKRVSSLLYALPGQIIRG